MTSFCKECDCEISHRGSHSRTIKHKKNCSVEIDSNTKLVKTAFKNRIITYHIYTSSYATDVKLFLKELKENVLNLLREQHARTIKINMELYGRYLLASTKEQDIKSFNSKYVVVTKTTNLDSLYEEFKEVLLKKALEFSERGSGWALAKLLFLELNINQVKSCC